MSRVITRNKPKSVPLADVLTLAEAAAFLRVKAKEVEDLVKKQGLPGRKIGKLWRFLRVAVEQWLSATHSSGQTVLDQWGALKDDPTYDQFREQIEENRRRLNAEAG